MGKRKKVVVVAFILAIVLVLVLVGALIYKKWAPSNVQEDASKYFKLKDGEIAILVDDVQIDGTAKKIDGYTYVPTEIASLYMDKRIYVDELEGVLSYATSEALIQVKENQTSFMEGKDPKETEQPILRKEDKSYYVSLAFIQEHTSNYIQEYKNPGRLIVMKDRDKEYTFATLKEDTRIRKGPGKKYAYWVDATEGERVIVENGIKTENEYAAVTTEDGITGYVPEELIQNKKDEKWSFDKEPEVFKQQKMSGTICLGWHQVMDETASQSVYSGISSATSMNVISPTFFSLSDNGGNFTSIADTGYVTQAHAAGKKVWGLVDDFKKGIKLSAILGATSSRTKLINGLVGKAIQYDLDGINIDFENVTKDNAAAYLQFLRELTLKAHVNDLIISVDNYTPAEYNTYYDLEEQGKIVDYVILMAYDEHYSGSEESGSVSSINFVKHGVTSMTAIVPKERVVVALPFYTRIWKETKGKKPEATAYGMSAAETIVRSHDATAKWDKETQQYYAEYKDGKITYKVWLEEETSLGKKLDVAKENKVAGYAFWKLGFERPATWDTISKYVKKGS